jgi:hypothetical protein
MRERLKDWTPCDLAGVHLDVIDVVGELDVLDRSGRNLGLLERLMQRISGRLAETEGPKKKMRSPF